MPLGQRELQIYEAETGEIVSENKWLNSLKALPFFLSREIAFIKTKQKQ